MYNLRFSTFVTLKDLIKKPLNSNGRTTSQSTLSDIAFWIFSLKWEQQNHSKSSASLKLLRTQTLTSKLWNRETLICWMKCIKSKGFENKIIACAFEEMGSSFQLFSQFGNFHPLPGLKQVSHGSLRCSRNLLHLSSQVKIWGILPSHASSHSLACNCSLQ